jgi:L-ascorbate metabolism protein UlaG (beta-lactamase superfamily)
MNITMIGHSCLLIETNGKKILTDPYFGKWGNPAFARIGKPALSREELSNVDAVLISHDHWDHTDSGYFRLLGNTPIYAPRLTSWSIKWLGGKNVIGVKAWQKFTIDDVNITVVPAVHLTVTIGYILECEKKQLYFAGDTFYNPFMQEIGKKFNLDAALMPVTTYRLPMTMDEKGAEKAVIALKPTVVIPIHLGITPRPLLMRTNQTSEHFAQRMEKDGLLSKLVILHNGESYSV